MEEIRVLELKKADLWRSLEQIQAKTSEILEFTRKDLEDHFDLVRVEIETRFREIEIREQKMEIDRIALDERVRKIEGAEAEAADFKRKVEELRSQVEQKEKELGFLRWETCAEKENLGKVQNAVREREEEMERRMTDLGMVAEKIIELKKQLCLKEELLDSRHKLLEQRSAELKFKDQELNSAKERIKICSVDLESKQREVKSLNNLKRELTTTEDSLQKLSEKLQFTEKKLDSAEKQLKQCNTQLESREKDMHCLEKSVEEINVKLRAKRDELDSVQKLVKECSQKLEAKQKQHDEIETSVKDLSHELKLKESDLSSAKTQIQQKLKEFESKEKEYNRLKASLKEREEKLEWKEKQFDARVQELEQYPAHFASSNVQQNPAVSYSEPVGQFPSNKHETMCDGVLASLKRDEVSTFLRSVRDPAKAVLDMLQGVIRKNHHGRETVLGESLVKNCVLLLEELLQVRQEVEPHVQSEALKLAVEWKGKMRIGNPDHLEALGLLEILVAYNLVDFFNPNDIAKLSWSIANCRHAPQLFQFLGLSSTIHDIILWHINLEQYIPAVRFILWFKLADKSYPETLLRKEINNLRNTSQNLIETPAEGGDAAKIRAILELIIDYKLEVDLPGDLIAKFMFQPESQNFSVRSFVSIQEQASTSIVLQTQTQLQPQPQPLHTTTRSSGPGYHISPVILPRPQTPGAFGHQDGSGLSCARSQQSVRGKRPRTNAKAAVRVQEMSVHRRLSPCFNSQFRGNGGC